MPLEVQGAKLRLSLTILCISALDTQFYTILYNLCSGYVNSRLKLRWNLSSEYAAGNVLIEVHQK